MSTWGDSQLGVSPWGGYSDSLFTIDRAFAVTTRAVRVVFTDAARALLPTAQGDALNASNWAVRQVQNRVVAYGVLRVGQVDERTFDVVVNKDLGRYETLHGVAAIGVASVGDLVAESAEVAFRGMVHKSDGRKDADINAAQGTFARTGDNDIAEHYGADVVRKVVERVVTNRRRTIKFYDVSGVAPPLKSLLRQGDLLQIEYDLRRELADVSGLDAEATIDRNGTLIISVNGTAYAVRG